MKRTFLDSGVLIMAGRNRGRAGQNANAILRDPERVFLTSPFVELETLPHALRMREDEQAAALKEYFNQAEPESDLAAILSKAEQVLRRNPLQLADALHVAAAVLLDADELITTEKPGKPIHQTGLLRVVFLEA